MGELVDVDRGRVNAKNQWQSMHQIRSVSVGEWKSALLIWGRLFANTF